LQTLASTDEAFIGFPDENRRETEPTIASLGA
jgi:hypothetical protein